MAFPDVPNFRRIAGTKLYRSSKLDTLDSDGIQRLRALNIMTVVDLRSPEGWEDPTSPTEHLMDRHYEAVSVKFSGSCNALRLKYQMLNSRTPKNTILPTPQGRRLFLNLIDKDFAFGLLRTVVPWYIIPWIMVLMISFLMCRIQLFLKEFARLVMNPIGITGQYQSIIKFSQGSVHATLRLISDPSNVPSVVCCAQGKDRTGVISALIMAVCGATREEIINEYAATEGHITKMSEVMQSYTDSYYLAREFGTAKASTMEALLDFIDKEYGSIPNYLDLIGFNREQQEQLRQNVTA